MAPLKNSFRPITRAITANYSPYRDVYYNAGAAEHVDALCKIERPRVRLSARIDKSLNSRDNWDWRHAHYKRHPAMKGAREPGRRGSPPAHPLIANSDLIPRELKVSSAHGPTCVLIVIGCEPTAFRLVSRGHGMHLVYDILVEPRDIPGIRLFPFHSNRYAICSRPEIAELQFLFRTIFISRRCNSRLTSAYRVFRVSLYRRSWFRSAVFVTHEPGEWFWRPSRGSTNDVKIKVQQNCDQEKAHLSYC